MHNIERGLFDKYKVMGGVATLTRFGRTSTALFIFESIQLKSFPLFTQSLVFIHKFDSPFQFLCVTNDYML